MCPTPPPSPLPLPPLSVPLSPPSCSPFLCQTLPLLPFITNSSFYSSSSCFEVKGMWLLWWKKVPFAYWRTGLNYRNSGRNIQRISSTRDKLNPQQAPNLYQWAENVCKFICCEVRVWMHCHMAEHIMNKALCFYLWTNFYITNPFSGPTLFELVPLLHSESNYHPEFLYCKCQRVMHVGSSVCLPWSKARVQHTLIKTHT